MALFAGQQGSASGTITYTDNTAGADASKKQSRIVKLAADFAYTLNHAIVCTLTDPFTDVLFGIMTEDLMAKIRDENGKITKEGLKKGLSPRFIGSTALKTLGDIKDSIRSGSILSDMGENYSSPKKLKSWFAGEFVGDFGAVPVVVAVQNFAPWLTNGIRKAFSPIVGPIFKYSAKRTAKREFTFAQQEAKGPEFEQRVEELYNREMEHLPNAVLWTVASPALNIAMQKIVMKSDAYALDLAVAKAVGATVTSSLTLGLRSLSPERAQRWDDWISKKAAAPIVNVVSKISGVDKEELKQEMEIRNDREHGGKSSDAKHGGEKLSGGKHSDKFDKKDHAEKKYGKKASDAQGVTWTRRVEDKEEEKTKSSYGLAS